jgi:hypothetical protein
MWWLELGQFTIDEFLGCNKVNCVKLVLIDIIFLVTGNHASLSVAMCKALGVGGCSGQQKQLIDLLNCCSEVRRRQ